MILLSSGGQLCQLALVVRPPAGQEVHQLLSLLLMRSEMLTVLDNKLAVVINNSRKPIHNELLAIHNQLKIRK